MDTIGVDLHKRESKLYILAPDRTATPTRKTYTQVDLIGESLRRARILVASSSSVASLGSGMATASTIKGPMSRVTATINQSCEASHLRERDIVEAPRQQASEPGSLCAKQSLWITLLRRRRSRHHGSACWSTPR